MPSLVPHIPAKEKPQGRNRSAPAIAAGPDLASCCWLCVGKMADPAIQQSSIFTPRRNVTRKLTRIKLAACKCRIFARVNYPNAPAKCRSQKCTFSGALRGSAGEPFDDQIAASETKAGSAHTAHDPALVSPGQPVLRLHPDRGMHLVVTAAVPPSRGCIETMRSNVTIVTRYL